MRLSRSNNNHDTAWKDILDAYFKDFVEFCLPNLNELIEWENPYTSLDKELHAITKDSVTGLRLVDKLVRIFIKDGEEKWVLVHIEVQNSPDQKLPERMFTYAYRIFDKYQKPIVSCAILTDENPNWRPHRYEVSLAGSCLSIEYLVIKLIDYQTQQDKLEQATNPFASVILVQLAALKAKKYSDEERLNLKYQLTKRLYEKGYDKTQIKQLYLFLDWLIHLPPEDELKYKESIYTLEGSKKMAYISTIERMGIERGLKKGRQEGEATLLIYQLKSKFGSLSKNYKEKIIQAEPDNLLYWGKQLLAAKTLAEVFKTSSKKL